MAFKSISKTNKNYEDIESLFRDLNTQDIQSLYSHQADILRYYQEKALKQNNVAIELPTGSGKTLVGLLIAEFRRRKYNEKVLYLCPTNQLVNQVVELSNKKYGIKSIGFTGSNRSYSDNDKFSYKNGDSIAVTSYSSLFNTNPWFEEPDLIVLDDAHTSENYISSCWSLTISRYKHNEVYNATIDTLKDSIPYSVYGRISDDNVDYFDKNIIEKFPSTKLYDKKNELFDILSTYLNEHKYLKYAWLMIKDHLEACQIYYSWKEILIRPLIPPSLDNKQFDRATQRIFMSATLGQGGDLERITGIKSFFKIPIPTGWEKQGMGRRLFMFPNLSLDENETGELMQKLLIKNERTVVLVSSDDQVEAFREQLNHNLPEISFFTAKDIEKSKAGFINSKKAAIVLANRFDGIDFAGDQSRLLFLVGIPYASNLQESFLQSRMNASIIFQDRNRTRLIQAIGRCTRSPKDYSAICVIGDKDLSEWLILKGKNKYLHPELQAELEFGLTNSKDVTVNDFLENFDEFLGQTDDWVNANSQIIEIRNELEQVDFNGAIELEKAAAKEVEFQYFFWNKQYENCFSKVSEILAELDGGNELRGYRAFWNYQASSIANILYKETKDEIYRTKSEQYLTKLINICPSASWSRSFSNVISVNEKIEPNLINNIERLQLYLSWKKISNKKQYSKYLKTIDEYISKAKLENLNLEIGRLLGYKCENPTGDGSPDPYWISSDKLVIVFEDKLYETDDGEIPIKHIRQAASHESWIRKNIKEVHSETLIIQVLISNRQTVSPEGKTFADKLHYWNYYDFLDFSKKIISLAREYQNYYSGENDSNWKDFFIDEYIKKKLSPLQFIESLKKINDL